MMLSRKSLSSVTMLLIGVVVLIMSCGTASARAVYEDSPTTFRRPSSSVPYEAAGQPGRIVSLSRRSIAFYSGDETAVSTSSSSSHGDSLQRGILVGTAFVKKQQKQHPGHHHGKGDDSDQRKH